MTGIQKPDSVFMAVVGNETVQETLFILPKDKMAERWTGSRLTPEQAEHVCAVTDIKSVQDFETVFLKAVQSEKYENIYMDFDKLTKNEPDSRAYELAELLKETPAEEDLDDDEEENPKPPIEEKDDESGERRANYNFFF